MKIGYKVISIYAEDSNEVLTQNTPCCNGRGFSYALYFLSMMSIILSANFPYAIPNKS